MREIEIKARVRQPEHVLAALEKMDVTLGAAKKQHDVVYSRPGAIDNDPNENWLRVRTENDQDVIFTLKRSVTGELDSTEHEVVVDSEAEITSIIGYLGYELFSDLTKVRRKGKLGEIEFCYDELPDLGTFIEAEKLCPDDADGEAVMAELWESLARTGVTKADEETHGYDVLMRIKEGKANLV
jgi:predicted adenylyl cyclase CyaB